MKSATSSKPEAATGGRPSLPKTMALSWQGQVDGTNEAFRVNGMMAIGAPDGVTYITKEQAAEFFGLPTEGAAPAQRAQATPDAEAVIKQSMQLALKALLDAAATGKRDHGAEEAAARLLDMSEAAPAEIAERGAPAAAYEAVKPRILSGEISSAKSIFQAGFLAGTAHSAAAYRVLDWILPSLQSMNETDEFGCSAEIDAVQRVLAGLPPALIGQPDDNLKARCVEIANWRSKGILEGNVLRQYAKEKFGEDHDALNLAEGVTITEALTLIASAPTERKIVQTNDPALAVIQYMLDNPTEDVMAFLHCWNEGDFDALRREWPDAPEEIYIGADPLYKPTDVSEEGPR